MAGVAVPQLRMSRSALKAVRIFNADRLRWLDEAASLGPLVRLSFGPFVCVWVLSDRRYA